MLREIMLHINGTSYTRWIVLRKWTYIEKDNMTCRYIIFQSNEIIIMIRMTNSHVWLILFIRLSQSYLHYSCVHEGSQRWDNDRRKPITIVERLARSFFRIEAEGRRVRKTAVQGGIMGRAFTGFMRQQWLVIDGLSGFLFFSLSIRLLLSLLFYSVQDRND